MSVRAPGRLFGEMSALPGKPCSATLRTFGEATARRIDDPWRFRPVLPLSAAPLLGRRPDNATACLSMPSA